MTDQDVDRLCQILLQLQDQIDNPAIRLEEDNDDALEHYNELCQEIRGKLVLHLKYARLFCAHPDLLRVLQESSGNSALIALSDRK